MVSYRRVALSETIKPVDRVPESVAEFLGSGAFFWYEDAHEENELERWGNNENETAKVTSSFNGRVVGSCGGLRASRVTAHAV